MKSKLVIRISIEEHEGGFLSKDKALFSLNVEQYADESTKERVVNAIKQAALNSVV